MDRRKTTTGRAPTARLLTLAAVLVVAFFAAPMTAQKVNFGDLQKRIKSEYSKPAKSRHGAIAKLGKFKSAAARRLLLEILDQENDGGIAGRVINLIKKFDHASIIPAFKQKLARANKSVHPAVTRGLGQRGEPGAQVLAAALERESRDYARKSLFTELRRIASGSTNAQRALIKAFPTQKPDAQVQILWSLDKAKKSPALTKMLVGADQSKDTRVAVLALRLLATQRHSSVRAVAMLQTWDIPGTKKAKMLGPLSFCLLTVVDQETLPAMLQLFGDVDEVRADIARLNRMPKDFVGQVVKTARRLSANYAIDDRVKVTQLLGVINHPAASAGLKAALGDADARIVTTALRCMENKPVEAKDELSELLQSGNSEHVTSSLLALHETSKGDRRWPKRLMEHVDAADRAVRIVVMDLLARLAYRPALERAQAKFSAETWPERSAAYAFALAVRDRSSVPLLIERLAHEDGRLLAEVHDTLHALTAKRLPAKRTYWARWWTAAGEKFELPDPTSIEERGEVEPGVLTYHGIPFRSKATYFIVDVSGSMQSGGKGTDKSTRIAAAKKALRAVIKQCADDVSFNVVPFSGKAMPWLDTLVKAGSKHRQNALKFIDGLRPVGGTNVYDALRTAFDDESVDTIYLLSDGDPSVGKISDPVRLAREVRRWNRDRRVVIHAIAIGQDREFMRVIAEQSGGQYVRRL